MFPGIVPFKLMQHLNSCRYQVSCFHCWAWYLLQSASIRKFTEFGNFRQWFTVVYQYCGLSMWLVILTTTHRNFTGCNLKLSFHGHNCYSGPHLHSRTVGCPWLQILLSGEQVWLVKNLWNVHLIISKCLWNWIYTLVNFHWPCIYSDTLRKKI